jgi:hypothetical protein
MDPIVLLVLQAERKEQERLSKLMRPRRQVVVKETRKPRKESIVKRFSILNRRQQPECG